MDIESLVDDFRRELPWHMGCAPKTAETSSYAARLFLRRQSTPFPACLTYQAVMAHLDWLKSGPPRHRDEARRANATVNHHLKSLKRFAQWAVARGYIESDPIGHLKGLPEDDRVMLAPSPETIAKLLAAAEDHGPSDEIKARNYALVCVLVDNGPRANELVQMDVEDVMENGKLRSHTVIHGKGSRDRIMPISPLVSEALSRYLPLRRPRSGEHALWVTETGGRMDYVAFRGVIHRICRNAGVKVSLHDFRRFALTHMFLSGMDQVSGMTLSGHKRVDVYMRYVRGAIALRALEEHSRHSPLSALLTPAG